MKKEYVNEELLAGTWKVVLSKITENARRGFEGGYPHYTDPESGDWVTLPPDLTGGLKNGKWNHGNWTAGFWPGLLWLAYAHTKDDPFKCLALAAVEPLKERTQDSNTHDIGFLFHSAFCLGCDLTDDPDLRETGLAAADTLTHRFNPKGQYIQAWGPRGTGEWIGTSTIDTMMNLPLLWWAFQETKSERYREVAAAHAKTTLQNLVREDHSTVHLGIYHPETGKLKRQTTFQGFRDESCWARGQSWGIYGFALAFEHTGHKPFLQAACKLTDYFLDRLPADLVPPYDFDAPTGPDTPRDSSAAAIAAGGMLQLAKTSGDYCTLYRQSAHRILALLSQNYLDHENQTQGIVKHACYSKPHNEGVDSCFIVGDYFFLKALHQLAQA